MKIIKKIILFVFIFLVHNCSGMLDMPFQEKLHDAINSALQGDKTPLLNFLSCKRHHYKMYSYVKNAIDKLNIINECYKKDIKRSKKKKPTDSTYVKLRKKTKGNNKVVIKLLAKYVKRLY